MNEINLLFDFSNDDAAKRAASLLEERFRHLEMIDNVQAEPLSMRFTGLEFAAVVAVTATLVQSGTTVVENTEKLLKAIRSMMLELRDLKNVYVDAPNRRVPIDQLDTAKLQELAKGASG